MWSLNQLAPQTAFGYRSDLIEASIPYLWPPGILWYPQKYIITIKSSRGGGWLNFCPTSLEDLSGARWTLHTKSPFELKEMKPNECFDNQRKTNEYLTFWVQRNETKWIFEWSKIILDLPNFFSVKKNSIQYQKV